MSFSLFLDPALFASETHSWAKRLPEYAPSQAFRALRYPARAEESGGARTHASLFGRPSLVSLLGVYLWLYRSENWGRSHKVLLQFSGARVGSGRADRQGSSLIARADMGVRKTRLGGLTFSLGRASRPGPGQPWKGGFLELVGQRVRCASCPRSETWSGPHGEKLRKPFVRQTAGISVASTRASPRRRRPGCPHPSSSHPQQGSRACGVLLFSLLYYTSIIMRGLVRLRVGGASRGGLGAGHDRVTIFRFFFLRVPASAGLAHPALLARSSAGQTKKVPSSMGR